MNSTSVALTTDSRLSSQDVAFALGALSTADSLRLRHIARLRVLGVPGMDWQDLLSEAVLRALDGRRRWPQDVPFVAFLAQTMRSIASEARSAQEITAAQPVSTATGEVDDEGFPYIREGVMDVSPEREVAARQALERVVTLFADDSIGLQVLVGSAEGVSPTELRAELNLTPTQYASTLKRIRRRLSKHLSEI